MPRPELSAELNATIASNRAKKQLRNKELARAGRVAMSFPVPLSPSQHASIDNMIACFIAQQRIFVRFTDDGVDKLVEIDSLPFPATEILERVVDDRSLITPRDGGSDL